MESGRQTGWRDRKDFVAIILVLFLLPIASQAGGLGIAAIAALGGGLSLIGLGPARLINIVKNTPAAIWALLALLVWGLISSLWSPYISTRTLPNPAVLLIGVPLFLLCARIVVLQSRLSTGFLQSFLIWTTLISAVMIFIDLISGYQISLLIDPVSAGESFESRRGDLIQNLGHGVSVLALVFPVIAVLLWQRGNLGKITAAALAGIIFICTVIASVSASTLALIGAVLFMIVAVLRPHITLKFTFSIAGLSLLTAPLFAYFATKLSQDQLASLPFSWEERVHNWRYMFSRIGEHPLIGHGFDAVRTFDDKHSIRGFDDRAIISLHPHNAGLHIWSELGAIGIALACAALFLAFKYIHNNINFSKMQKTALSGVVISAVANCSLTYGVWQDWWWSSIVLGCAFVALISSNLPGKKFK